MNEEKGVESAEEALKGAMDIIAENVSDNAEFRKEIRSLTFDFGFVVSKATTEADTVYAPYYDYNEKVKNILAELETFGRSQEIKALQEHSRLANSSITFQMDHK